LAKTSGSVAANRVKTLNMSQVTLNREGLRQESFTYLAQQKNIEAVGGNRFPITVTHVKGKTDFSVHDGRHRLLKLIESGKKTTQIRIRTVGPRGGITTTKATLRLQK
jgi:uncharacterized ParB-like nuclease family protein